MRREGRVRARRARATRKTDRDLSALPLLNHFNEHAHVNLAPPYNLVTPTLPSSSFRVSKLIAQLC
jgi:hypothetical protein